MTLRYGLSHHAKALSLLLALMKLFAPFFWYVLSYPPSLLYKKKKQGLAFQQMQTQI